jgi:hypothetical protein
MSQSAWKSRRAPASYGRMRAGVGARDGKGRAIYSDHAREDQR